MKVFIILVLLLSTNLFAECGSGITNELVSDGWMSASFRGACEQHDLCYETCGAHRHECDLLFHHKMKESCRNSYGSFLTKLKIKICLEVARNYYRAVNKWGENHYLEAQLTCKY